MNLLFDGEAFRLHPASIATLAEAILAFLILVYFLSLRGKTRDTWLMAGFVGTALLVYLVDIGVTSSRPPLYNWFRVSHAALASVWALTWTWCAYTYGGNPMRREATMVILAESLLLAVFLGRALSGAPNIEFSTFSTWALVYYTVTGCQAWSVLVLARRTVAASRRSGASSENTLYHLLNAAGRTARSLRALALLFASYLPFMVWALAGMGGAAFAYQVCQMVLLLGVLVVHLSYASEVTTFQVKLVALPLATVLALLGLLPFLLYGTSPPEADWGGKSAEQQRQLAVFFWLLPAAAAFVVVAFIGFYRYGLLRPLGKLLEGVRRIEEGNFNVPVPIVNRDEVGVLAGSLNKMAASLKASQEELEGRVAERTAALQESLVRLKAVQSQLIQREKLASLGELTAGIAHEIQNPLNFINNFSEVSGELVEELREETKKHGQDPHLEEGLLEEIRQNLQKIHHHGLRADAIVKGMLQHSRTSGGEKQAVDANALAEEYLRLAYSGFRAKDQNFACSIETNFDLRLQQAQAVPQELGQVLLNLFHNAFYAVRQKHKSVQVLGDGEAYAPKVSVSTRQLPGQVEIRVRDNGVGMAEHVKSKVFQPFFTTKPTGEGTGLGLSISYDIITKGHGGELEVTSEQGEWAEFTITLPSVPAARELTLHTAPH